MNLIERVSKKTSAYLKHLRHLRGQNLIRRYSSFPRFTPTRITFGKETFSTPDAISVAHQLYEVFTLEKLKFTTIHEQPVIFDCGANVGVVSIYFKKLFPRARIVAFEADAKIASYMRDNLRDNSATDVVLIEKAAWVHNKGVAFGSDGADGGSIYFERNQKNVPSVRLRDYLVKEKRIDLLKIDVEGAEVSILKDCMDSLKNVEHLCVEYHSRKGENQELDVILNLLSLSGFRYLIENATHVNHPFTDTVKGTMDFQVNIYAHRKTD